MTHTDALLAALDATHKALARPNGPSNPKHAWHAAFLAHCRRQGIEPSEVDAVIVEEFERYMRAKTKAGRRAEREDAQGTEA